VGWHRLASSEYLPLQNFGGTAQNFGVWHGKILELRFWTFVKMHNAMSNMSIQSPTTTPSSNTSHSGSEFDEVPSVSATTVTPTEAFYNTNGSSMKWLVVLCIGLKDINGDVRVGLGKEVARVKVVLILLMEMTSFVRDLVAHDTHNELNRLRKQASFSRDTEVYLLYFWEMMEANQLLSIMPCFKYFDFLLLNHFSELV
jgi:hypothetical protein